MSRGGRPEAYATKMRRTTHASSSIISSSLAGREPRNSRKRGRLHGGHRGLRPPFHGAPSWRRLRVAFGLQDLGYQSGSRRRCRHGLLGFRSLGRKVACEALLNPPCRVTGDRVPRRQQRRTSPAAPHPSTSPDHRDQRSRRQSEPHLRRWRQLRSAVGWHKPDESRLRCAPSDAALCLDRST